MKKKWKLMAFFLKCDKLVDQLSNHHNKYEENKKPVSSKSRLRNRDMDVPSASIA